MSHSIRPSKWIEENKIKRDGCRIFDVYEKRMRHPERKESGTFYVIESSDWVLSVPLTKDGRIVMVEQYRFGANELCLEIPGGVMHVGENPIETAERELLEETGFKGDRGEVIGWCYPNPAIMNNRVHFVLIRNCVDGHGMNWDEHEEIKTHLVPLIELRQKILKGEILHGICLIGLNYLFLHEGL